MVVTTSMIKIMMKYYYVKKIVTGTLNDTQHPNNASPKTSPIDCDGVLLTNAQCHMAPISILWYIEYWTIQLKCPLETRQETITVSNHPIHQHGQVIIIYNGNMDGCIPNQTETKTMPNLCVNFTRYTVQIGSSFTGLKFYTNHRCKV